MCFCTGPPVVRVHNNPETDGGGAPKNLHCTESKISLWYSTSVVGHHAIASMHNLLSFFADKVSRGAAGRILAPAHPHLCSAFSSNKPSPGTSGTRSDATSLPRRCNFSRPALPCGGSTSGGPSRCSRHGGKADLGPPCCRSPSVTVKHSGGGTRRLATRLAVSCCKPA